MTTLYLVRHGRTVYSDSGRIAGSTDVALSEAGRQLTTVLAQSGVPGATRSYCSDLQRTWQTSDILGACEPVIDPRIRELDFGEWEQRTWEEIHAEDSEHLSEWSGDWVNRAPPGGETFAALAARCEQWLSDVAPQAGEEQLLVTTHGGTIRALICIALDLPLSVAMSFAIDYSSVSKLQIGKRGNLCQAVNSTVFGNCSSISFSARP